MEINTLEDNAAKFLMNTYGERPFCLVRGQGTRVFDSDGNEYLDFLSGIGVNNLGHCHPAIVKAIKTQCEKLIHCSNLYLIQPQIELAKKLVDISFADKCFFSNSGAEANEGAIKLARLYSRDKYGENRYEIISMKQSFHGRTMATLSATGQIKIQKGFEPLLEGFQFAEFNNVRSVKDLLSPKTCAVIVEPVQGEGGIIPAEKAFLSELREICTQKDLVLIFDEVQCGLGRTGKVFAYEHYNVIPDVLTLAKALGGGVPIGALLACKPFSETFTPGKHAHTFGGNPLASATALAFIGELIDNEIAEKAAETGAYLKRLLGKLVDKYDFVKHVRGPGLMVALVLDRPGRDILERCLKKGLLLNCTCETILRLLPPLIITREECDEAVRILDEALSEEYEDHRYKKVAT